MQTIQTIRCPNCGSLAERQQLIHSRAVRTQCRSCDYLLITSSDLTKVIEAYAPGVTAVVRPALVKI